MKPKARYLSGIFSEKQEITKLGGVSSPVAHQSTTDHGRPIFLLEPGDLLAHS
jgi:hypothetical protein